MFKTQKKEFRIVIEEPDSPYVHKEDDLFRLTRISVDDDNNFYVEKEKFFPDIDSISRSGTFSEETIFALSSRRSRTIEASFSIPRDNSHKSITEGELEHLIFRSVWQFLNKYRKWACVQLGISDFDLVLADVQITKVAIDNHSVLQPLGLKGESFNVVLRGTFTSRSTLEDINKIDGISERINVLERLNGASYFSEKGDAIVHLEGDHLSLFHRNSDLKIIKSFSRGVNPLIEFVSQKLDVSHEESLIVLEKYFNRELSSRFTDLIKERSDKYINDLIDIFNELREDYNRVLFNVPDFIYPYLRTKSKNIFHFNFKEILEDKGFRVIMDKRSDYNIHNEFLVLAGASLFLPRYKMINDIVKRRAGWLVPTS